MGDILLPLEYLLTSSRRSLEAFELSRLACSSNLRKEICQVLDEWVEAEVGARLTRWILEHRRVQEAESSTLLPRREEHVGPKQLVLFFLPTQVEVTSHAALCNDSIILARQASLESISPPRPDRSSHYEGASSVAGLHAYRALSSTMALDSPSHRVRPFSCYSASTLKCADGALRSLEHLGGSRTTMPGQFSLCGPRGQCGDSSWRRLPISFPVLPHLMFCNRSEEASARKVHDRIRPVAQDGMPPARNARVPFGHLASYMGRIARVS